MDFTIEVERRGGHQKTKLKDLRMFHGKCDKGEIKIKKFLGTGLWTYLSLICKKCKTGVVVTQLYSFKKWLLTTAVDGLMRNISQNHYRIKGNVLTYKILEKVGTINFTIIQVEPEKKTEKKSKKKSKKDIKTIGDLKGKITELEKTKKEGEEEAQKTIGELEEKLAKLEKSKREPGEIYCPYCGAQLILIGPFCPLCGANIEERIKETKKVSTPNK